jgi:hypothetical protein
MGELLKQFDGRGTRKGNTEGSHGISQREVAERNGISDHRQLQASRVANVPAIEGPRPATVTRPGFVTKILHRAIWRGAAFPQRSRSGRTPQPLT